MYTLTTYCRRRHVLPAVLCLLGWFALATPAAAQSFFLPVEIGDGVLLSDGSPRLYVGAVRVHFLRAFGSEGAWRIGLSGALAYTNPELSFQVGARLQKRLLDIKVAKVFSVAQVDVAFEGLWDFKHQNVIGGPALLFSVNRVVHFTFRGGYEKEREAVYFGAAIGTDLTFLDGRRLKAVMPDPIPRPPVGGCLGPIYTEAKLRAQASFRENPALHDSTETFLDNGSLTTQFRISNSLAEAKEYLADTVGLNSLAQQIDGTLCEQIDFQNFQQDETPNCDSQDLDLEMILGNLKSDCKILNTLEILGTLLLAWDRAVVQAGGR